MALLVVLHEFYTTEEQAQPFNGNLVVFFECRFEVIKICYVRYFDAEVVDDKKNGDGPPHVTPQFGRVLALIRSSTMSLTTLILCQIVLKYII